MNYLEQFLNHEILINIRGASIEELMALDEIIGIKYCSGDRIYQAFVPRQNENKYLHCRVRTDNEIGLTFSDKPYDVYKEYKTMPYIMYHELLDQIYEINIHEEDLNKLFE